MVTNDRVDLHILACLARPEWLDAAIASVEGQARVQVVEGERGHIGRSRARALAMGTAEFVAWVDDDDLLEPGAVARCVQYLDDHPDVISVYSDVIVIDEDGAELQRTNKPPWSPIRQLTRVGEWHHFHMARRSCVEAVLPFTEDWSCGCEEFVLGGELVRFGPHHHIPEPLYRWRQKTGPSALRTITRESWSRAIKQVTPTLLRAHKRGLRQI